MEAVSFTIFDDPATFRPDTELFDLPEGRIIGIDRFISRISPGSARQLQRTGKEEEEKKKEE